MVASANSPTDLRVHFGFPPGTGQIDTTVTYVLVVPGDDDKLTALQAFSVGFCDVSFMLRYLAWLPAAIIEMGGPWDERARLIESGVLKYRVIPQNAIHLHALNIVASSPFCVVLSTPATDKEVSEWVESCSVRPLHVTTEGKGGDICLSDLNEKTVLDLARSRLADLVVDPELGSAASEILYKIGESPSRMLLDFQSTSHNALVPNELLLVRLGYEFPDDERLDMSRGDAAPIEAIERSTKFLLSMRDTAAGCPAVIVATPGRSRLMERYLLRQLGTGGSTKGAVMAAAVRQFKTQAGYFMQTEMGLLKDPAYQAVVQLRSAELRAFTDAIAVRAISEHSAFVRLPPAADAIWATLKRLADCYRGNSSQRQQKLSKLMSKVKKEIADSVPVELRELLDVSAIDVRIVSDLPLEWTPLGGGELLMFRHVCSRIPTRPGNVFVQTVLPGPRIHLQASQFKDILVVRSFAADDPVADVTESALSKMGVNLDTVSFVDVNSEAELIDALNAFSGPVVVFDAHGQRTLDSSGLWIGGQLVDPWSLRGKARVPPIVLPLVCDTLPLDGEHSSAATAFLAGGARTVMGSLLPIHATKAALFLARLIRALHRLLPVLAESGVSQVSWAELFSVVQKTQFVHETAIHVREVRPDLDDDTLNSAVARATTPVYVRTSGWFEVFRAEFTSLLGLPDDGLEDWLSKNNPLPDVALLIQQGDPESIIVHLDDDLVSTFSTGSGYGGVGIPDCTGGAEDVAARLIDE